MVFCRWRPLWEFSIQSFKELFGFGSKLLASGLIDTIYKEIYSLVIGGFYSAADLGQYTRASQFNTIFPAIWLQLFSASAIPYWALFKTNRNVCWAHIVGLSRQRCWLLLPVCLDWRLSPNRLSLFWSEKNGCPPFLFTDHLFFRYALSAPCYQSEYSTGERAFRLVFEAGNY